MTHLRVYTFLVVSIFLISLQAQSQLNGWNEVDIDGSDLENATIQVGGVRGIYARCHPDSLQVTPDFSSRNRKHICPKTNVHYAGTYGKLLKVRTKEVRGREVYALQIKVTDKGKSSARDQTQTGQVSWIYFDSRNPRAQLYSDTLATMHPLERYLRDASKGKEVRIPWVTEEEDIPSPPVKPGPGSQSRNKKSMKVDLKEERPKKATEPKSIAEANESDDNNEILPKYLVRSMDEVTPLKEGDSPRSQPALPGTSPMPAGKISKEDDKDETLPPNADMCSYNATPEKIDKKACLNRPPQRIRGKWRKCPVRTLKDIGRHAGGKLAPWLIDVVNTASKEVAEHSTVQVGNSCASPAMMMTLMDQESTFHPMSHNTWGDHGIAQFQMGTAKSTFAYIRKTVSSSSPMNNVIERSFDWKPKACRVTTKPWARKLSSKCFEALKKECEVDGKLVTSLYCPQFAVRLQAFHIKQICATPFYVDAKTGQKADGATAKTVNLTEELLGNGSQAAEARFVASRYNRGNRIFNSAVHYFEEHKEWPSAKEYGKLWDVRRPAAYQRKGSKVDPSGGGNLFGHSINRCYNWRTVGLCGGMEGTVFDKYRQITCRAEQNSANKSSADGSSAEGEHVK